MKKIIWLFVVFILGITIALLIDNKNGITPIAISPDGKCAVKVHKEAGDDELGPLLIAELYSENREPVEIDRVYEGALIMKYDKVVYNIKWTDNTHVMADENLIDITKFTEQ